MRFRDLQEIGRGGTAVVHQGYDPLLERYIAIKVLAATRPDKVSDGSTARERFLGEARITGQLEHPNIVPVYEFGAGDDGRDYLGMKLVEGTSLLDRIRALGDARLDPEPLAECLDVLTKVCDGVAFAHSKGIVHRDLKPSNVMIGGFGEVYVMDWGIALRTTDPAARAEPTSFDERGLVGTPTFVAPEQIDDPDGVDPRADVYALGGILYALLTAQAPHQGRTPMLRLMASSHGRIREPAEVTPDPRLPPALARLAMRALRRDPADRPQTVGAFKAELLAFQRGAWRLPTRSYPAGARIVVEGDRGDEAFVVKSGTCRVSNVASGHLRDLGPGEVFGELAILSQKGVRTSTVEAVTDVELQVVTRDVLRQELGLNTWIGAFVSSLAARFAEIEARAAE